MTSKAMASTDAAGYREVVRSQDQQQMVAFLQRMIQLHHLPEVAQPQTLQTLARQHLKGLSSFEELLHELRALASQEPSSSSDAPRPDAAQALRGAAGASTLSQEALIDGQNLVAQAVEGSGVLALVSPPWSLRYVFGPRNFQLVIRNVVDPTRGLVLGSSPNEQMLRSMAEKLISELGTQVALLGQAEAYQTLHGHPALLARLSSAPLEVAAELQIPTAPPEEEVRPDEEHGDCPICLEAMGSGEAAMRCAGDGGQHHYFHARCLSTWVRRREGGASSATCPMCRGQLQMNGQRLQEFLDGEQSAQLSEDDRTYLQSISDGLRGRNSWSTMNRVEKAAYAGGLLAAASWGFVLGYTERRHRVSHALVLDTLPAEHQLAQGLGWLAGIIVSCIRQSLRDREDREDRESRERNRRC